MPDRTPLIRRGATRWALLGALVAGALIIVLPTAMRRQPAHAQANNLTPFELTVPVNVATNRLNGSSVIPVAQGQRVLVKRVSLRGVVPIGQTWAFSLGVFNGAGAPVTHYLPFAQTQPNTVGTVLLNLVVDVPDGIYADPLLIRCNADRNIAGAAATINFTVSGLVVTN